jgi:hypothetical protein
MAFFIDPRGA